MMSQRVRIRTPSRLHFGLLSWGPHAARQFGGVGLMIDAPNLELTVERSPAWVVEGPLAARVARVVNQLESHASETGHPLRPCRIKVESAPPEHVGLGVGTQLSLAVARAVFRVNGAADVPAARLARLTGRGLRSGVGLHGFEHGGLIVDGGRRNNNDVPPLLTRLPFPEEWSILVLRPREEPGLNGLEERRAFDRLPPVPLDLTEALCKLVLLDLLPAVVERDLPSFGAALSALQTGVGSCFAPAQGGVFLSMRAASIVDQLKNLGFLGVGQSSWGPTLYGFSGEPRGALAAPLQQQRLRLGIPQSAALITSAAHHGATLTDES